MKVGDFVELSAYGKRLKCNREMRGRVGLVVEVDPAMALANGPRAIMVSWSGSDFDQRCYHIRQDLKYIK